MKKNLALMPIALGMMIALVGCDSKPPENAAGVAGAGDKAKDVKGAAASGTQPILVDSSTIAPFESVRRINGTWTEKGCTWMTPGETDSVTVTADSENVYEGYFVSKESGSPGDFKFVLLGDKQSYGIPVKTNVPRPDVAEFFKSPAANDSGFIFKTNLKGVAPGTYTIDYFYQREGVDFFCETGRKLIVS